jgi:hypothetical protein
VKKLLNAKADLATSAIILLLFAFAGFLAGGLHG